MAFYFIWLAALGIALAVGWAHGRRSAPLTPSTGDWRAGYVTGYDDAREQCLRIAKAHDFNTVEHQISRMQPRL